MKLKTGTYIHTETGKLHNVIGIATDETKYDRHLVIYHPKDNPDNLYAREVGNFFKKIDGKLRFEKI